MRVWGRLPGATLWLFAAMKDAVLLYSALVQLSEDKVNLVIYLMLHAGVFSFVSEQKRAALPGRTFALTKRENPHETLLFNLFYFILHCCICGILGAQRTKAKTKKKQWWRPWVDHASSRLTPQPSFCLFLHYDWPLCPWPERWGFPYCLPDSEGPIALQRYPVTLSSR